MQLSISKRPLSLIFLILILSFTLSYEINPSCFSFELKSKNQNKSDSIKIHAVVFSGLYRTDETWARHYLNLDKAPLFITIDDLNHFKSKLLTTGVFSNVEAKFSEDKFIKSHFILEIICEEKWTKIPVIRAQLGGGTPLLVLGGYDTHSFGRLLTLGGEFRKYGDAASGGVIYGRAPRLFQGQHSTGIEWWRDIRMREIYSIDSEKSLGILDVRKSKGRIFYYYPLSNNYKEIPLKIGLDITVEKIIHAEILSEDQEESKKIYSKIDFNTNNTRSYKVLPSIIFDNITKDNLNLDGMRIISKIGARQTDSNWTSALDLEFFSYFLFDHDLNFSIHAHHKKESSTSLLSQEYLGGFDSIRGIPDGAIFGSNTAYLNSELRHIFLKSPYLWLQSAFFVDAGSAGEDYQSLRKDVRASTGIGLRIAVPQIYRLMLRIDFAWSLDHPGQYGLSAGLNQLFQPYRPL